ncbi:protein of unknown function [Clostridium beijerinckii]|nr:protein of unknown function [Clostridium beijerinckii]
MYAIIGLYLNTGENYWLITPIKNHLRHMKENNKSKMPLLFF